MHLALTIRMECTFKTEFRLGMILKQIADAVDSSDVLWHLILIYSQWTATKNLLNIFMHFDFCHVSFKFHWLRMLPKQFSGMKFPMLSFRCCSVWFAMLIVWYYFAVIQLVSFEFKMANFNWLNQSENRFSIPNFKYFRISVNDVDHVDQSSFFRTEPAIWINNVKLSHQNWRKIGSGSENWKLIYSTLVEIHFVERELPSTQIAGSFRFMPTIALSSNTSRKM